MWSLQTLKDFFKRHDFDFNNPHLDLYVFHPQLRILLGFNGIFFNSIESKLRLMWPLTCTFFTIIALMFEIIFMQHSISTKNYVFATESFCYSIIISSIPIVNISVFINKQKLVNLLECMNKEFVNICSLDERYKTRFLHGQLLIWQLCYVWFIFTSSVGVVLTVTCLLSLTYQSLFMTQEEKLLRSLPLPMWLPNDVPYKTPNYEVFLIFLILVCFNFNQTFSVYVYIVFHTILHYYYLLEMIFLDFEVLFNGLDETVIKLSRRHPSRIAVQLALNTRMERIVNWHVSVFRSVKIIPSIYGMVLVFQVLVSSIVICLTIYQIAEYLDRGEINFLFILMCLATCLQLWIPCYLGTLLRNQGFAVGEVCWNCGWQDTPLGQLLRQDIIITILRAQQPVNLKFTGLPNLELETFSSIMSTSYSYFNILRQYQ